MFGNLVAAFGLTVLCLAPILLVALVVPIILLNAIRPMEPPKRRGDKPTPKKRSPLQATVAFARFYLITVIVMVTLTVAFWFSFITFTGVEAAADFAAQSLPVEPQVIQDAVEPAIEDLTQTP